MESVPVPEMNLKFHLALHMQCLFLRHFLTELFHIDLKRISFLALECVYLPRPNKRASREQRPIPGERHWLPSNCGLSVRALPPNHPLPLSAALWNIYHNNIIVYDVREKLKRTY